MAEREEPLPARIDRYEPLKKLATGGMAEIFLAKQGGLEGFEKVVVLKRILGHLASDEEFVSMFLDEARIAAKLSHPNIVQIYDLGKSDNTFYIAMEYVSGRNIQHLITKHQAAGGHLPVEHVCRIIAGVCDGLFYAHSRKDYDGKPLNIIHRDISPQNILVSFAGGVKVVDFGIAKASTQLAQTRAGVLKGKYAYMSPEQVRGSKIDGRSDVFAVGLVMYEMLTGMRAFERESSLKTLKAIVQDKPLNPREMNPEIPMEVVKILSKSLEKNPDRRYKSAQDFQLALEDWLEQSPKKSNNVRLSRFLYELFDDELNSAEGTMVVKGVGQVIIPTSRGDKAKPAVEEEIDSKTLTQALADVQPNPPASAGVAQPATAQAKVSSRVRDELAHKGGPPKVEEPKPAPRVAPTVKPAPRIEQVLKGKTPPPEPELADDDDGKTVPGYDLEQLEKDRLAHLAAKARAAAPPVATAENGDEPDADESEEKTRAGVPMSTASVPDDEHVIKLFEKVESLVQPALAGQLAAEKRQAKSVRFDESVPDDAPLPPPGGRWEQATRETPTGGLATAEAPGIARPAAAPGPLDDALLHGLRDAVLDDVDDDGPPGLSPGEQPFTPQDTRPLAAPPAKRPPLWYALVGTSAALSTLSLLIFAFGAFAMPGAAPLVEYGVVVVTANTGGATVMLEGTPVTTPGQLVVPLDGVERTLDVMAPGFKTKQEKVSFAPGTKSVTLNVTLEPG